MATSVLVGLLGEPPSLWKAQLLLPLCAAALAVIAWCAARSAEWGSLRPRRLERALRAQGIRGTAYRPLVGDAPLSDRLACEARSRPPLPPGCHAIVPRAMPLVHHAMNEHGRQQAAAALAGWLAALFHKALKEAFEVICNKGDSGKSSAKLLATFCDNILKKGCSEKLSDEAIEDAFFEKGLRSIDTVTSFQKMSLSSGVLLLDNDRFYKEEEKKDAELAKKLAYVADLLCQ